MKAKVRYKVIDFRGDIAHKTVLQEFPDFSEYEETLKINGSFFTFKVSVEEQCMSYLDNQDKLELMETNGWHIIVDYSMAKSKTLKNVKRAVAEIAEVFFVDLENGHRLYVDFIAAYSRLYKNIKNLKPEAQFKIIVDSMNIGYDAQSEAYRHATLLIKSISDSSAREELKLITNQA